MSPFLSICLFIGSWGAALINNYNDRNSTGILRMETNEYKSQALKWASRGYQLSTHAIGDKANRIALDTYEHIQNSIRMEEEKMNNTRGRDFRFRIDHAQILDPSDVDRFAALNITPCMQVITITFQLNYFFFLLLLLCSNIYYFFLYSLA